MDTEHFKALLDVQSSTFKECLALFMQNIERKFDKNERQIKELNDPIIGLKYSLEFSQAEIDEQKTKISNLIEENTNLKSRLDKNDVDMSNLQSKVLYIEDQSRRNNIRFVNVPDEPNESWEQTADKVKTLLKDNLEMAEVPLARAHRIGKFDPESRKARTVVAKFERFQDREMALRNARKLKSKKIYIFEDLGDESQKKRIDQLPALREARKNGQIAYFNYTKLITRPRRAWQTGDEIRQCEGDSAANSGTTAVSTSGSEDATVGAISATSSNSPNHAAASPNPGSLQEYPTLSGVNTRSSSFRGGSNRTGKSSRGRGGGRGANKNGRGNRGNHLNQAASHESNTSIDEDDYESAT